MRLSASEVRSAVRYNDRNMARIGWTKQYAQVAELLGLGTTPSAEDFAQALADWQFSQRPRLDVDGKLGESTWRRMKPLLMAGAVPRPIPKWVKMARPRPGQSEVVPLGSIWPGVLGPRTGPGPAWLDVARYEMSLWQSFSTYFMTSEQRKKTEEHLDWDEAYFAASPKWGNNVHDLGEAPRVQNMDWCAAFVNYCLHRAGFSHTGSAGAASFARRGAWRFDALKTPRVGCVIVTEPSHVAFLVDTAGLPEDPGGPVTAAELPGAGVQLLGGNQSQTVREKRYKRLLRAARGENGVTSPYLWPLQGTANCNIGLPTAQPHFCSNTHER